MDTNLKRANKVTVAVDGANIIAKFFKTHDQVGLVTTADVKPVWDSSKYTNRMAEREAFRQFVCDHASEYGIYWNPVDQRTESNLRCKTYATDADIEQDIISMMNPDITELMVKCPNNKDITQWSIDIDSIQPMTKTAKGYDLSKMGVEFGKYMKNGNWAWADISATITLLVGTNEIYFPMDIQLVSGQLRKPHITQTAFNESIATSIKEITPEEEPTPDAPTETIMEQEPVVEESTPKRTRKSTKKDRDVQ